MEESQYKTKNIQSIINTSDQKIPLDVYSILRDYDDIAVVSYRLAEAKDIRTILKKTFPDKNISHYHNTGKLLPSDVILVFEPQFIAPENTRDFDIELSKHDVPIYFVIS